MYVFNMLYTHIYTLYIFINFDSRRQSRQLLPRSDTRYIHMYSVHTVLQETVLTTFKMYTILLAENLYFIKIIYFFINIEHRTMAMIVER